LSEKGLPVRDPLTGLYTDDHWQHASNLRLRRLFHHMRPRDLGRRFGDQRQAVALMSCQAKFADRVGERIAHNISGAVLGELPGDPCGVLQIGWVHLTLPDDASTPIPLLSMASDALDRQMFGRDGEAVAL